VSQSGYHSAPDESAEFAAHLAAMATLGAIPGVVRVAFGLKERAGSLVETWAYRVYVPRKRPSDELSAAERIPAEVDGVATDVLTADVVQHASKTPHLDAGDPIARNTPNVLGTVGTLGLIVRRGAERLMLTNAHVLSDHALLLDTQSREVYRNEKSVHFGFTCNEPAGDINPETGILEDRAIGGKTFHIDATLATLRPAVTFANRIDGLALDQGIRDLSDGITAAIPPSLVTVKKRGRATRTTDGQVAEFFDSKGVWALRIRPAPGAAYDEDFEIIGDDAAVADIIDGFAGKSVAAENHGRNSAGNTKLHLTGHVFCRPGDSGSPVIDDARHVVGMVYAGGVKPANAVVNGQTKEIDLLTGDGFVEYIAPVLTALGLDAAAIVPPGAPAAGTAVALDALAAFEPNAVRDLEAQLELSASGRLVLALATRHLREIADLVHHRRHVKVVWYRNKCHAFTASFAECMRDPAHAVPDAIEGIRREDAWRNLASVLALEGSDDLRAALHAHGPRLAAALHDASTLPALLDALAAAEPAGAAT
jgi:hypothetical protein